MTFREILKARLLHDLGFEPYDAEGAPLAKFRIVSKSSGILCGMKYVPTIVDVVAKEFFLKQPNADPGIDIFRLKKDGDRINPGDAVAELYGNAEILLKAERMICNVLVELSAIATYTRNLTDRVRPYIVRLLDTRKDDPLMRAMHKYAVRVGGGKNHRFGFFDGILVKDNDIAVYGGVKQAIDKRIGEAKHLTRIEVEVGSLEELEEVLQDGRADAILLDNMSPTMLRVAVDKINETFRNYLVEASGVGIYELEEIARTGVSFISLSALVRKGAAENIDISMKAVPEDK